MVVRFVLFLIAAGLATAGAAAIFGMKIALWVALGLTVAAVALEYARGQALLAALRTQGQPGLGLRSRGFWGELAQRIARLLE